MDIKQIAPRNEVVNPRTEKALQFQKWADEVRNLFDGRTQEDQKKIAAANEAFLRGLAAPRFSAVDGKVKAVTPTAVHVDSLLAGFSKMYANDEYIGERCMPVVPVQKRSDKYTVYPKRERFAAPDDRIGYRSSPNEIEESRSTDNYSVEDFGFKNYLDLETAVNEDAPLSEMIDLVESINELMALKREARIAAIVTNSANYDGNTAAVSSTNWNDATGGTIISDIQSAVSSLYTGQTPTKIIGVCPINVWNAGIFNNPALAERFKYTAGGATLPQQVAAFFGMDELYICKARHETANEGQTASYARMWNTDVFAVLRVALRPTRRSLHFGSTFRMANDPFTSQWSDPGVGKRGGIWARVSVSEDHKVVAGDAGFLLTGILT